MEYSPEKEGSPQLNNPPWLDLLPPAAENRTKTRVNKISMAMKVPMIINTWPRVIPATVLETAGKSLGRRSPRNINVNVD